jgi:hypothetical protein
MRIARRIKTFFFYLIRFASNICRLRDRIALVCIGPLCAGLLLAPPVNAQSLTPAWVELGEGGKMIARIVVADPQKCPPILINALNHHMVLRQPIPDGFRPVCEFEIPAGTRSATINSRPLVLAKSDTDRVIAVGDTGCRIKGEQIQNCNDPDVWPFKKILAGAEIDKPQLFIHVGDYLYRESPCPEASQSFCGGTPVGDNWGAWNADFFTPAARMLPRVPWVFNRGNHEDCNRSWRGWFYYLDPRPWTGTCEAYSTPYIVKLGTFELAVLDTSAVKENDLDETQVAAYAAQLTSLDTEGAWLVTHHPFWGIRTDFRGGPPVPIVATLQAAWEKAAPTGFSLLLSGHVHLFEYVSIDHDRPSQLVVGDGGTEMSVPIQISTKGMKIRGATVVATQSRNQFGYTLLSRDGSQWKMELKNQNRDVMVSCTIPGNSENCQSGGTP